MAIDEPGPLQLDPYQSIINVNWAGPKHFLAVGAVNDTGHIQKSKDGIKWDNVPAPSGAFALYDAAYGDGCWIVTGHTNRSTVWRSENLTSWSQVAQVSQSHGSIDLPRAAWGKPQDAPPPPPGEPSKGVFVVCGRLGNRLTSKDGGKTWTEVRIARDEDFPPLFSRPSFAGGMFFIGQIGQTYPQVFSVEGDPKAYFWTSSDGASWTKRIAFTGVPIYTVPGTPGIPAGYRSINGAIYVLCLEKTNTEGEKEKNYIAIGFGDAGVPTSPSSTRAALAVATSSSGLTWRDVAFFPNEYTPVSSNDFGSMGAAGKDNIIVPVSVWFGNTFDAPGAKIGISETGSSWSFNTPPGADASGTTLLHAAAFSPSITLPQPNVAVPKSGAYVVGGALNGMAGRIYSSPDGKVWSSRTNSFSGALFAMIYGIGVGPVEFEEETA